MQQIGRRFEADYYAQRRREFSGEKRPFEDYPPEVLEQTRRNTIQAKIDWSEKNVESKVKREAYATVDEQLRLLDREEYIQLQLGTGPKPQVSRSERNERTLRRAANEPRPLRDEPTYDLLREMDDIVARRLELAKKATGGSSKASEQYRELDAEEKPLMKEKWIREALIGFSFPSLKTGWGMETAR